MLWTKQIYLFDVNIWLEGDRPDWPPPESRKQIRNQHWRHLNSMRVMSMPDKWEYPWFAAWDLAFHCVPLAVIDPEFAKEQLWLLLFEQFQHPSGQIPAYEWEFSDLNPPVQAWAVWRVYNMDRVRKGKGDRTFLEKCFHKLLINFAWWVNKVDSEGNNVFEGGFLGLDNITVIDRSEKLPHGAVLEQSDATGWMGMLCLQLMRIALELARENKAYEGLATKFFQHYIYVGAAMKRMGGRNYQLFDEADGFFYDVLRFPDGTLREIPGEVAGGPGSPLRHREAGGEVDRALQGVPGRHDLVRAEQGPRGPERLLSAEPRGHHHPRARHRRPRADPAPARPGLRPERVLVALRTAQHVQGPRARALPVRRLARSATNPPKPVAKIKGGNSNWRGPIWFPTIVPHDRVPAQAGHRLRPHLQDPDRRGGRRREAPVGRGQGDGRPHDLASSPATRTAAGPATASREKFQTDPHWRDLILFYEYFHGDTGEGLGASHQTGWTGLVASLIDEWRKPPQASASGRRE